ncbi:MAG TPA: M55 family metallopeptidase [Thermomicrobiaceae bacterium]|nr:M55 family metallopeptidase [Thermomicrobiaceae bacterium]
MRVLVIADMEGISGIETVEACAPDDPAYPEGQRLLAAEVNALAGAARAAGASDVGVIDWHGSSDNLDPAALGPGVRRVAEDLSVGYDVACLIGFHAMAGTRPAFISHTMFRGLALEVAGRPTGEIGLISRWAGEWGVPVALVAGDRAATLEAEAFLPETPTLTMKQARSWDRADALPVEQAHAALRAEVARALARPDRWHVYRPETPVRFRLRLREGGATAARLPWLAAEDGGWLAGELPTVRGLIDLIDVLAALGAGARRAALLGRLRDDPAAGPALRREEAAARARAAQENPWP